MSSPSEDKRAPGSLSLIHAASDGDVETMRALLASGADPNTTNHSGQSALMVAALMGHAELVALLLEAGADPEANDRLGLTALEWSKRRGFSEVTELLVNVTPTVKRAKPKSPSEPTEVKTEKELNNAVEEEPHPEQLGPASRAAHKNFLAHRTDEEVTESRARETEQEHVVVTMPETPSMEPAGEPAGEAASATDAVIATEPDSAELELPITSERQPLPADQSVLDLSTPQDALSDDSQSPETYTLVGDVLEPEQDVLEAREDVLEPEQDVLEAREDVLEPREDVLEPEQDVPEAREGVLESREDVLEPEQGVLEAGEDVIEAQEDLLEQREDVPEPEEETLLTDEEETLTRSHPTPALEPPRAISDDPPAIGVLESKPEHIAPEPATDRSRFSASLLGLSATTSDQSGTVVNLKRCPKCNRTFQNTQLSYCPRDYGTLVSIDDLKPVSAPSQVSTPAILWVLVAFVLGVSGFGAYKLAGYFLRREAPPVPVAAKPVEKPPETKKPNFTVGGALAGLEVVVPEPAYPAALQNSGITGPITVRIRVNKKGRVISAVSSRGDSRLRAAAVKAATQATFSPEKLEQVDSRTRVVSGTITYQFSSTPAGPSTSSTGTASPSTGGESAAPTPATTSPAGTSNNADPNAPVVSESLAGAAVKIPTAEYPKRAKASGIGGTIIVTVRVNHTGKVVSWRTSTGDSQLRSAALNAARKATFSPGKLPGDGDVLGTITYKFPNSSRQ